MTNFKPKKAFEHIDKLSYEIGPRLSGSERSEQTKKYIESEFEDYELSVEKRNFEFLDKLKESKLSNSIIILTLVISVALNIYFHPVYGIIAAFLGILSSEYLPEKILSKETESNILGKYTPENPDKKVLIGAHYDTAYCLKNWKISIIYKILKPVLLSAFSILLITTIFTELWLGSWIILAIPFMINFTVPFWGFNGLVSPGAEDNSSGLSVLLESARVVGEEEPEDLEVQFIALGAEEQGLVGSKNIAEDLTDVDQFLNLDSLGSGDELCIVKGNGVLGKKETSEELRKDIREIEDLKEFWAAFAKHDHLPFLKQGVKSTTLTSENESQKNKLDHYIEKYFDISDVNTNRLPQIHTMDDVPEKIRL